MNRQLTALFASFEAILVIAIGIAIPLAPLTILWGAQFGFAADWVWFWRAAVDTWLLGHGVDITFSLNPSLVASLGVAGAETPFTVTIAALGIALMTVLLAVRAGRRIAETNHTMLGQVVALAVFAGCSLLVALSAVDPVARPSLWQATLVPTLIFGAGLSIGIWFNRRELDSHPVAQNRPAQHRPAQSQSAQGRLSRNPVAKWLQFWPAEVRAMVSTALRGGAAAAAGVILAASMVASVAIAISFARIIGLYESLQTEYLGGVIVTLGQLALLPNIVIWVASWLIGPGFAIGTGSIVGPLGTQLGPVPVIPLLGALPQSELAFGFLGLLVPVVVGFLVGALLGPRVRRELNGVRLIITGLALGVVGGAILALLAWFSGGSAGPGRLVEVGPDPIAVGLFAALEIGVAAALGLVTTLRKPR
jgi:hypothetical protein